MNFKILFFNRKTFSVLLLCLFATTACDDDNDDNGNGSISEDGLRLTEVATGLDTPWQLAIAPDGRIFFTERPGRVRVIENDRLLEAPWLQLDSVVEEVGESGLTGIALDPQFEENGYVYLAYTYAESISPLVLVNKLVRYREDPQSSVPVFDKTLLDNVPGNYLHNMGTLLFGPDGKLYVAVGETFKPELAQDLSGLNGKILRLNSDGTVPSDNPFADSYVYSYGHRNPQGLAFHPETGELYSTEHGPSEQQGCCRDEINLIEAGENYGWPIVTGNETEAGLTPPLYTSGNTVTWAPAGATFLTQGEWKNSLLFGGLRGESLYRAVLNADDPPEVAEVQQYFHATVGRIRYVAESPDGDIYIATSNFDGRGVPRPGDDKIMRLVIE